MNYEFCDGMTHTIKKGDTLYSISRMHDVPIAMIMRANPYVDVYNLQVGDTICIPVMSDNMQQRRNNESQMQNGMQRRTGETQMQNETQRSNSGTSVQNGTMTAPAMSDIRPQEGATDNTSDSDDICESGMSGEWARYVSQPGDTLQDIMDRSESSNSDFWMKNSADRMHILPGIAYYVYEKEN